MVDDFVPVGSVIHGHSLSHYRAMGGPYLSRGAVAVTRNMLRLRVFVGSVGGRVPSVIGSEYFR